MNNTLTGFGSLLAQAFAFYKQQWKRIIGILVWPVLVTLLIGLVGTPALSVLGGLILIVVTIITQAAFFSFVVAEGQLDVRGALSRGKTIILPLIVLVIISTFVNLGAFSLLIVPGIIMSIWLMFSVWILVAENERGLKAMVKSWLLAEGYWWAIFGRFVLLMIVMIVASIIFGLVAGIVGSILGGAVATNFINSALSALILTPLTIVFIYKLFQNLKSVKGSVDLLSPSASAKRKWLIGFMIVGIVVVVAGFVLAGAIFSQLLNQLWQPGGDMGLNLEMNPLFAPASVGALPIRQLLP